MSPDSIDEKEVFNIARHIGLREARAVLESPAVAVQANIDRPSLDCPGTVVGPYKLVHLEEFDHTS
jgi:hypothetical protein